MYGVLIQIPVNYIGPIWYIEEWLVSLLTEKNQVFIGNTALARPVL